MLINTNSNLQGGIAMPKPKKKPPVALEVCREWLRRNEEEGETAPQIAEKDGYDPRTVRKQLELARQDRERKEARSLVLRNALGRHYDDLVLFVGRLDDEIAKSVVISIVSKQDRLWKALRQHLPRSPLWKAIDRLDYLNSEIDNIRGHLEQRLQDLYQNMKPESHEVEKSELNQEGITGAVMHRLKIPEVEYTPELKQSNIRKGEVEVGYGPYNLGIAAEDEVPVIKKFISHLMNEALPLPGSADMRLRLSQRRKVVESIREELATIKLRRIVSGRCKYCPI
jgi:hypothetical protein